MSQLIDLQKLPQLADLFRLFNAGKHLNHLTDTMLWVALEQQHATYQQIFHALGYQLCVDPRGFAYFSTGDARPNVSKTSRQLALLLMLLFEQQADTGANLADFSRWRIDREWLSMLIKNNRELLEVEQMDSVEALEGILKTAVFYGFAEAETDGWRLLAAVWRYLEYFEQIAQQPEVTNGAESPEHIDSDQASDHKKDHPQDGGKDDDSEYLTEEILP
ncbi:MAG: hypothetical protein WA154_05235 [Moraxellaceae bacterium]